jgi:hypothetical protein
MDRIKIKQNGYGTLEVLLVVLIIVVVGGAGYLVYKNHNNTTKNNTTSTQPQSTLSAQVTAYRRTTTIPSSWKTYTNTAYKFTVKYPADWHLDFNVSNVSPGNNSQNDFSEKATKIGVLCYLLKGETQTCDGGEINIANQSLQDTAVQYKKAIINDEVLSQKNLTIDGHQAVIFRTKQAGSPVTDQYFVYSSGNTYAMPTVYESDGQNMPISANESLMLFEAIKIQ